jgi:hypothetical protein
MLAQTSPEIVFMLAEGSRAIWLMLVEVSRAVYLMLVEFPLLITWALHLVEFLQNDSSIYVAVNLGLTCNICEFHSL